MDCKGVKMMANPTPNPGSTPPVLAQFVFGGDVFSSEKIPRGLSPRVVTEFVRVFINVNVPVAQLQQVEKVIDFYDVYEATPYIKPFLDGREATPEAILRSVVVARILAKSGTTEDRAFVRQYYPQLVARISTLPALQECIRLYAELAPNADPMLLRQRIDWRIQQLQMAARPELHRFEILELKETTLQSLERARRAGEIKQNILVLPDRPVRIAELIKIYLTIDYGYLEYLQPWAARQLRREVWAEQPANQTERIDNPTRRRELVEAFRKLNTSLDSIPTLSAAEVRFVRVRALRAIHFFGGQLSADELLFLTQNAGQQLDTLSN
jgi:hypothetical protein